MMWFSSEYLFPFQLPFHNSTILIRHSGGRQWAHWRHQFRRDTVPTHHEITRVKIHLPFNPNNIYTHSNPDTAPVFVYRSFCRYIEHGGKSELCVTGNFPSLHTYIWVFEVLHITTSFEGLFLQRVKGLKGCWWKRKTVLSHKLRF
jgi:hypothetical protein